MPWWRGAGDVKSIRWQEDIKEYSEQAYIFSRRMEGVMDRL